jgi:GNAT superfamily N-acetyltransferase
MWTIYRHVKGMNYLGLGEALHSEEEKPLQVYRCLYDNDCAATWARPLGMFHEPVASGEPRFTPIARVRPVVPEDEALVLGFGYEAWGQGQSREDFIASYASDRDHLRGKAYLLELPDGIVVTALNTLRFSRDRIGLARVATAPGQQRKGGATLLVRAVMEIFRLENSGVRFLLFSEVDPGFYARFGFVELPKAHQHFPPSVGMISGNEPLEPADAERMRQYF